MQAPQYPDPTKTAAAQADINKNTAITQSELNQVNQVTPTGSLTYNQIGTNADGTPRYQATTALSPDQQGILDKQTKINSQLGDIGVTESAKLGQLLAKPFDVNKDAEDQLNSLASARLDPQIARNRVSLEQQLANKGVKPGSEAWNNAINLETQGSNDARNQLYLTGHQQAVNDAVLQRTQPINEILALGGQTQVAQPGFQQTPQSGVAPVDYTGQVQSQYGSQLSQYNGNMQAAGNIAGTVGGWLFSDERLKSDVRDTGAETKDGIPLKTFRYKGSPMMQMGVIAQDAEKKRPDAVKTIMGKKAVNYDRIGSPMLKLGAA